MDLYKEQLVSNNNYEFIILLNTDFSLEEIENIFSIQGMRV